MAVDPIHGDILGAKITSNDGSYVEDTTLCKPGAKDSIGSQSNVTEPFAPSQPIGGPYGGMKTMK
jgi:hypothetical protein